MILNLLNVKKTFLDNNIFEILSKNYENIFVIIYNVNFIKFFDIYFIARFNLS